MIIIGQPENYANLRFYFILSIYFLFALFNIFSHFLFPSLRIWLKLKTEIKLKTWKRNGGRKATIEKMNILEKIFWEK